MGCCQNRDDAKVFLNRTKGHTKSLSIDVKIDFIDQDSMLQLSTANSSVLSETQEINERNLLLFAQTCSAKKKWEQLAPLLLNTTEVKMPNVYIPWTEKPKSISCIAMVYLSMAVKKYTIQVSPYIEVFLPVIVSQLKSNSPDLKENAIYLLYSYADFASELAINKLLSLNVFGSLTRWLLSSKNELRKYTVNLCYKIYKDRPNAKKEFIKANGGFYLVQLIGWNGQSDFLNDLINNFEELIVESDGSVDAEKVDLTREPLTLDILKGIDTSMKSIELKAKIEKLVSYYQ